MRHIFASRLGVSTFALLLFGGGLMPAQNRPQTQSDASDVIVILRDQLTSVPPVRGALQARAAAIAQSQSSVLARLQAAGSRRVRSFSMINAFATTLSKTEAEQLAGNPLVKAVVADAVIRARRPARKQIELASVGVPPVTESAAPNSTSTSGLCNTLEPEALQLTQAAFPDSTTQQAQLVLDGTGHPVTGAGVKVAFLADGLDTTLPGFIRPDGSSVFIDYQDFSGDPAGTPTAGGEAFGDASSIAAQDSPHGTPLLYDISQFVSAAHPLPSPCNIRIRGIAPGASLVGLKVFSQLGYTTNSSFVQAIEWAVIHDDVDVINESFGGNPYFDSENDPISLANQMAVRAGVTVVVSSGDAASMGTLGSPATDPDVISAGASTQFRLYAQTTFGAQALANGYISNNISALSSGGFAQLSPRTIDVVAPGDSGWALCSTNSTLYTECGSNASYSGRPLALQSFGGTSEAAPLTSGLAALVIQAYRSVRNNQNPGPALVKQIIMSTATDLGAPSDEQGAGLINAFAAVNAALSAGSPFEGASDHGDGLLITPASSPLVAAPNTIQGQVFSITNTGTTTRHLAPLLQTLGAPIAGGTLTLQLAPASDPTFPNVTGAARDYITQTFTVGADAQHLDAAIAYNTTGPNGSKLLVYLALLDPTGRQAAYSLPQGTGAGYAHVDVVSPAAGAWTAVIFGRPSGSSSYSGPVKFTWSTERFVNFGNVVPARLDLAPGATGQIATQFITPAQPGDTAAALRFDPSAEGRAIAEPEAPFTVRTLIPLGPTGADFIGTLTGGNARSGANPTQTYQFDTPPNVNNLSLSLQTSDSGYPLVGWLVDPNGMPLSVEQNVDLAGNPLSALQLFRDHPQPGRWYFVLQLNPGSSGNQTALPFTAHIRLNSVLYSAAGLPNDPAIMLSASGPPVVIPITVTNTGLVPQAFFADARGSTPAVTSFSNQIFPCTKTQTLPGVCLYTVLPTQVQSARFVAQSTVPIDMDVSYTGGGPDIYAAQVAPNNVAASLSEPELPWGPWYISPSLIGPFGPAGAPTEPVQASATAVMKPFDAAITSDSGDFWFDGFFGTNTFNPLVLAPGASGVIHLTIKPDATQIGHTITGTVYLDTQNVNSPNGSGDEVASIPYAYTIAPSITPLKIATTSLSNGTVGAAYSQTLTATGGTGPYLWSLTSGRLPFGLTLNPLTGQISGIPTSVVAGSILQFQVTDSSTPRQTATASLLVSIGATP